MTVTVGHWQAGTGKGIHLGTISVAGVGVRHYPCDSGSGLASVTFWPAPQDVGSEEH